MQTKQHIFEYLEPVENERFRQVIRPDAKSIRNLLQRRKSYIMKAEYPDMPTDNRILDQAEVEELVNRFLPLIRELEGAGIDYCVVGGLAVIMQQLANGTSGYRMTRDIDLIVPESCSDSDFGMRYLDAFSQTDSQRSVAVAALEQSKMFEADNRYPDLNTSLLGIASENGDVPSVDICRKLNSRNSDTVVKERLVILGQEVWVATVDELIDMKQSKIELLKADISNTSRIQDFIDLSSLNRISMERSNALKPQRYETLGDKVKRWFGNSPSSTQPPSPPRRTR